MARFTVKTIFILTALVAFTFACVVHERGRQQRIDSAAKSIHSLPSPSGTAFDPTRVIQIINQLHALGERDALEALRRFSDGYASNGYPQLYQHFETIIPILFVRRNPSELFPSVNANGDGYELDSDSWDDASYVKLQDGVPFHRYCTCNAGYGGGANSCTSRWLLDWASSHGQIRSDPVVPSDNPFEAAENLVLHLRNRHADEIDETTINHIRTQAAWAVYDLLPIQKHQYAEDTWTEENWVELKMGYSRLKVRWDKNASSYASESH